MNPIELGLPHREPFVFVDEVEEVVAETNASGWKIFIADTPMFSGHFPGNPMVPGVILTEALAQMAGIAGGGNGRRFLLSAIRNMKFPAAARPGERIELSAKRSGAIGGLWMFETRATVNGAVVAEGQIVLNEIEQ